MWGFGNCCCPQGWNNGFDSCWGIIIVIIIIFFLFRDTDRRKDY